MATFYQVSILGQEPCGGLFQDRSGAEREVRILQADDQRYAAEALEEGGVIIPQTLYEIHEVEITL